MPRGSLRLGRRLTVLPTVGAVLITGLVALRVPPRGGVDLLPAALLLVALFLVGLIQVARAGERGGDPLPAPSPPAERPGRSPEPAGRRDETVDRQAGAQRWVPLALGVVPVLLVVDVAVELSGAWYPIGVLRQVAGVLLVVGTLGHVRSSAVRDRASTLDAMTVAMSAGVLTWAVLDCSTAAATLETSLSVVVTSTTAFLALGTALRLLLLPQRQPAVVAALATALASLLAADLVDALAGTSPPGPVVPACLLSLLAAGCTGVALTHPGFEDLAVPDPRPGSLRLRGVSLVVAGLVPTFLLGGQAFLGWHLEVPFVLVGWGLLLTLTAARISHLSGEIGEARARHRADVRFHAAFDHAMVGMALVAGGELEQGRVVEVNQRLCDMLGRRASDLVGHQVTALVTEDSYADLRAALDALHESGQVPLAGDRQLRATEGRLVWARLGLAAASVSGDRYAVLQVEDVSDGRLVRQRLQYQATHDPLTGLANRVLLADRLGHALARRNRRGVLALLAMDLDRFKQVNDAYGHAMGDQLLRVVAHRLTAAVRPEDTVARLGGDEFVVLLEDLDDATEATAVADRISHALAAEIELDAAEVTIAVSIGIAVAGQEDSATSLLRNADTAMYHAKENGRSRCERYDERMRELTAHRERTEEMLRDCLAEDRLQLAVQPVVDLGTGAVAGYEALIRCERPAGGLLSPGEFLRVAEESGLIVPIGDWVIRTALDHLAGWDGTADGVPTVAVNLSARQLLAPDFAERVIAALEESGVAASRLCLEIGENTFLETVDRVGLPLRRLRDLGVVVALDDFGTGYSSLAHLRHLPVDMLKIDRSFVAGLLNRVADANVVRGLIGFAHALGLRTVAEGVETERQRRALVEFGCDLGQGYLLGSPFLLGGSSGGRASRAVRVRESAPALVGPLLSSASHDNM